MIAGADGEICPRDWLNAEVWGEYRPGENRTLDLQVATLRTKLRRPRLVMTVRGMGCRLNVGGPEATAREPPSAGEGDRVIAGQRLRRRVPTDHDRPS
ncbi:winged helix-turn-helix domain-containing protein [Amycolatopsis sp. NPDC000673]|uniref:winged helix-turn-helix domain-containing protein n=1 Tax=unclassified Amycolatopsis TaxID=2618356 RepID=UPI003333D7BE